jgi:hypothetical protein
MNTLAERLTYALARRNMSQTALEKAVCVKSKTIQQIRVSLNKRHQSPIGFWYFIVMIILR